jgi:hypothetical protein
MKVKLLLLALGGCVLLGALPKLAAEDIPCNYSLGSNSDAMVVCSPTGSVYDSVAVSEANEDSTAIYSLSIAGPDPAQFGFATTLCESVDPCGPGLDPQYYSDIFGVSFDGANLVLSFSSGDEFGSPYGFEGFFFIPEPDGWVNATSYLDPTLVANGYTAWFISSPPEPSSVPEPSSLILLGSGLTGFAVVIRRKLNR